MIWPSWKRHTEIVKALIAAGADVSDRDNHGDTVLMAASSKGHTEIVKALIVASAHVIARDNRRSIKDIIAIGNNVNIKDNRGSAALAKASKYGHKEIVRLLEEAGATE